MQTTNPRRRNGRPNSTSYTTAEGTEILDWVVPDGATKTDLTNKSNTNWDVPYSKLLAQASTTEE